MPTYPARPAEKDGRNSSASTAQQNSALLLSVLPRGIQRVLAFDVAVTPVFSRLWSAVPQMMKIPEFYKHRLFASRPDTSSSLVCCPQYARAEEFTCVLQQDR